MLRCQDLAIYRRQTKPILAHAHGVTSWWGVAQIFARACVECEGQQHQNITVESSFPPIKSTMDEEGMQGAIPVLAVKPVIVKLLFVYIYLYGNEAKATL